MRTVRAQSHLAASSLLLVMMITGVLTTLVASYLWLTASQNQSVMRSLSWNAALPLAEAGVEEALSHLNKNITNYAAEGWTKSGTNFSRQRNLGGGYYNATIGGAGAVVKITSTGYQLWRDTNYITRTVQINAKLWTFRQVGLVAKSITFGGDLEADSYDSSNPLYSTAGQYDPAKATDQVMIATPGLGFSMGGSSRVLGYVATGPGGAVSLGGSASVGDRSFSGKGIQAGHQTNNYVLPIADVQVPFTSGPAPASGTVSGVGYNYVLNGRNYMASRLDSGGASTTLVVAKSSVLYVTGNVSIASITFAPGARLDLYVATPSINFSPAIIGATPQQFTLWGLPTCTSLSMNSGTVFTGVIYAPELDLRANGGAAIYGSILANSFNCSGTFDFHFDLATANSGVTAPVTVLSWTEL